LPHFPDGLGTSAYLQVVFLLFISLAQGRGIQRYGLSSVNFSVRAFPAVNMLAKSQQQHISHKVML
jgi:hypothetical protein